MKNPFKYWWLILIKGILLIVLAFYCFFQPVTALLGLAVYIGISLLVTGVFMFIGALVNHKTDENFGWHLTIGLIDIMFAFVLLTNPVITAAVFPFIVGFWAIVYGIMIFANSFKIKKSGEKNWWMDTLGGILGALMGYLVIANPVIGALSITFWIGMGLLLFGILNIFLSFRIRKI